jgi:uncharacterized protein (TIGR01777 family)
MLKILITGASGLIGNRLTDMLLQAGHQVVHLGRSKKNGRVPSFVWDVDGSTIEEGAFNDVDTVIHLAGAGVADRRWSAAWKKEILESRIKSTALLVQYLEKNPQVKTVVSASAIGYYGVESNHELIETDKPGTDFLANVVEQWEAAVDNITNKRVVKLRVGIVLSDKGGALKQMAAPIRLGVGAPLGSGKQAISWIHLDDLCSMFVYAVENENLSGAYNATGPYAVTNQELTKAIAHQLQKPLWLPPVPGFVLKIMIGEMADMVVKGSVVSSRKIQQTGFKFQYPDLETALRNLLNS